MLFNLSDFRGSFSEDYQLLITDGPLKGLCSRAVIIVDENGKIIYAEQVPEIKQEPDYESAIDSSEIKSTKKSLIQI